MDIIGKYLRLRREVLESLSRTPELAPRRLRVSKDLVRTAAELEEREPDRLPFLETMPWSDTIAMSEERQGCRRQSLEA